MGHVEADHGGRGAGAEQVVGGIRVLGDVGFHPCVAVARHGQRAAHEHHAADLVLDFRSLLQGGFDVGHRAGRNVDEVLAVGLDGVDDEVDGRFGFDGAVGVGDVHVAAAVVAVDERGDGQHFEVVGGAGVRQALVDLDFRVAEQVGDGERGAHKRAQVGEQLRQMRQMRAALPAAHRYSRASRRCAPTFPAWSRDGGA